LIVSAVKICKQCLQTVSASGDYAPRPLPGLGPWTPLWTSIHQAPWAIAPPKWKLLAVPLTAAFDI